MVFVVEAAKLWARAPARVGWEDRFEGAPVTTEAYDSLRVGFVGPAYELRRAGLLPLPSAIESRIQESIKTRGIVWKTLWLEIQCVGASIATRVGRRTSTHAHEFKLHSISPGIDSRFNADSCANLRDTSMNS